MGLKKISALFGAFLISCILNYPILFYIYPIIFKLVLEKNVYEKGGKFLIFLWEHYLITTTLVLLIPFLIFVFMVFVFYKLLKNRIKI